MKTVMKVNGKPGTKIFPVPAMALETARADRRRRPALKVQSEVVSARIRATIKRNKVAPPFRTAGFGLRYAV